MLLFAAPALLAGCDNVGRAFDPDVTPPNPGPSAPSTIQVPPVRGDMRDGRPVVRAAYPKAGGWPATVPIVVEFSESMNESSIVPTTTGGLDGKVILRLTGTTTALPCVYDFLGANRLLVMRPLSGLQAPAGASFEVAMLPGVRDADGVQFAGTAEQILATFTLDTASTSEDGKILAVFPRDNVRDLSLDTELIVVFTKPPNAAPFLQAGNFVVRTAAGVAVPGLPEAPLAPTDTRIVRFRPTAGEFAPGTGHEFVVTNGITFGQAGVLDFGNRTPFSRFTTGTVPQPLAVKVGNPTPSFDDKINRSNLPTLQMGVDVPAGALAGDRVLVRVYGLDRDTRTTGDLAFVERSIVLAAGGAQTVLVDFANRIGSVTSPRFEDGVLSYVVQLQRGSVHSGVVLGAGGALQDTIAPTLSNLSSPLDANGTDLLTELEHVVVAGKASEQLGDLQLTAGGAPVHLFGSRPDGSFVSGPLPIGRRTSPIGFSLAIFDRAGNEAAAPLTGNVVQRGVITGSSATGDLTVEAYDDATLRALAGVTVFVDPDAPTFPAAPGRVTGTTDAAGRAVFTGLVAGLQSITLIRDGYDPVTLYKTTVGYASLPLRPSTPLGAVATFTGTATPESALTGASSIVGNNLFDDPRVIAVRTGTVVPMPIPPTAIVPNRLQVVTGFGGVFEPTANPGYAFHACNLLGGDVATPSAPPLLVPAGGVSTVTLLLRDRSTNFANLGLLSGTAAVDFNQSQSLNVSNLTQPVVRFLTALDGFRGQVLSGVGFGTGSPIVTVTGSYSTAILDGLAAFNPRTWASIEVEDDRGSLCRIRRRVDTTTASGTDFVHPQWIPVIGPPTGPFTGPPLVTVFEALDAALVTGTGVPVLAVLDVVATNALGREWRIIAEDTDPRAISASDDFQFPDPGTLTGLGTGDWVVRATARLFLKDTRQAGDFALADRAREELSFARGSVVPFTVQ